MQRHRWENATLIPGSVTTWLRPQPIDDKDWFVGCGPCQRAAAAAAETGKGACSWRAKQVRFRGPSLQMSNLLKHGRSACHLRACAAGLADFVTIDAPPDAVFDDAWGKVHCGMASSGATSQLSRTRTTSLEWCLSEAIQDDTRAVLQESQTISLQLDERHGRLLVKYHACANDLVLRVGVLALLQDDWEVSNRYGWWCALSCPLRMHSAANSLRLQQGSQRQLAKRR